jgi:hypothetical protein
LLPTALHERLVRNGATLYALYAFAPAAPTAPSHLPVDVPPDTPILPAPDADELRGAQPQRAAHFVPAHMEWRALPRRAGERVAA